MVNYYKKLYLTKKTEKKIEKIKWKLAAGAGMVNVHLIALSENENDVFDIYPAYLFKQRYFRKRNYTIVGVAENKRAAMQLVQRMIEECCTRSGSYEHICASFLAGD